MPAKNAWNARQSWVHKPGTELIKANQQGTIHKAALKTTKAPQLHTSHSSYTEIQGQLRDKALRRLAATNS